MQKANNALIISTVAQLEYNRRKATFNRQK